MIGIQKREFKLSCSYNYKDSLVDGFINIYAAQLSFSSTH